DRSQDFISEVGSRVVSNTISTRIAPEIVAIGISTGGPNALVDFIPQFKKNFRVPIVLVQHMPKGFTKSLAESLDRQSEIEVKEAEDSELLRPGCVFIAPGGNQMKVVKSADAPRGKIVITDEPPESFCKPSVNYLYRSLSTSFAGKVLPVILTGMGDDGTKGLKLLKRHGGVALCQDEKS
ncbi:MAG: chemotaxis protein CheB, partial [Proteobacteria bacterium]|nr:chemotaxis protein CheB [Pseudomonadota bacterium]